MTPHDRKNGLSIVVRKDNHENTVLRSTVIAAAVAAMLGGSAFAGPVHKRADSEIPNIVLILTDDQSWVGTSLQIIPENPLTKSDYFRTPNIERLGAMGMRFTQGYSPPLHAAQPGDRFKPAKHPLAMNTTRTVKTGRLPIFAS